MLSKGMKEDVIVCNGAGSQEAVSSVSVCNGSKPEQQK